MVSWTDDTEDTILFFIIQWLDQRNWGIKISQNSWTVTLGPVSFEQPAQRCQKPSTWACVFWTPLAGGTQGAEEPFLTPFSTGWDHSKAQSLAHLWLSGLMPKRQRRLNVSLWPRNRWRGTPPSVAGVSSPCLSLLLLMQVSPIAMVCPYMFNLVQGEPFFVAFADFCSVNTPTMADVCGVNTPTMPIWSYQHDVTEHRAGKNAHSRLQHTTTQILTPRTQCLIFLRFHSSNSWMMGESNCTVVKGPKTEADRGSAWHFAWLQSRVCGFLRLQVISFPSAKQLHMLYFSAT